MTHEAHQTEVRKLQPKPFVVSKSQGDRLITVRTACEQLAIGKTTLYRFIAEGQLVTRKLGRSTRITTSSVDRLIAGA